MRSSKNILVCTDTSYYQGMIYHFFIKLCSYLIVKTEQSLIRYHQHLRSYKESSSYVALKKFNNYGYSRTNNTKYTHLSYILLFHFKQGCYEASHINDWHFFLKRIQLASFQKWILNCNLKRIRKPVDIDSYTFCQISFL